MNKKQKVSVCPINQFNAALKLRNMTATDFANRHERSTALVYAVIRGDRNNEAIKKDVLAFIADIPTEIETPELLAA
jgi:predicted transcriptional regulator